MQRFQPPTLRRPSSRRRGATLVETAVVLPVFFIMISGVLEFGHVYMVIHALNSATNKASRFAATEGSTNAEVQAMIIDNLDEAFNVGTLTVRIKDAAAYDDEEIDPQTIIATDLPDLDLSTAQSRQLLMVRVEVNYDDITIVPSFWKRIVGATLKGQSIMRHE